jgi:hypothetical protein
MRSVSTSSKADVTSDPASRRVDRPRLAAAVAIVLGILTVAAATLAGSGGAWLDSILAPPPLIRAALVGLTAVLGGWLLLEAIRRMSTAGTSNVRGLIRAVRLVFLGVAAFAASAGWIVGNPLPLLVAAVIAGIDVIETSFLLLVVGRG